MEEYWIQKQNLLLQRHRDAFPGQREFWFHNIVDELNEYQAHIDAIRERR